MSDNNLRLQVILNAVDKLTRPFRAAQASSKELAGAIQNTRNSLKELNKQAGRIDEFRKTRSQLAITANNLNAAREEAAKLATQFAATNRPTAAQAKLFSQAKTRVQELQQTYNGLLGAVQRQRQALKESGIDTRQLSSAQRELKKNAEETRQALEGQQRALKRLGEQQARMNAAREQYSRRLEVRDRIAGAGATTRREKSWHKTTVGEVVKEIASRHKLKMALGKDLSDKLVEHIDQTNESDGSFLMRLARQYGAIASVKNGNLLFIRQGQGKSASGKPLPVISITRKDGDSHRFTLADRGAYTGVIASWLHTREPAKKESTTVKRKRKTKKQKKEPEAKQGDYLVGTDENVLVLNRTYANRSNAERAAKMQWERLQRGVASFSLQLAEGRADLYTEMPVKVSGFKQPIDDAEWTITTLTHTVSPDNGFTTSLELEVRIGDLDME
ncbi:contractile injection system protein, VgrG/Pvc8 family [Escherichia coli O11:H16,53]